MSAAGIGSVAVCEGSRLVGILTEQDVLRLVAEGEDLDHVLVGDAMTTPVRPPPRTPTSWPSPASWESGESGTCRSWRARTSSA